MEEDIKNVDTGQSKTLGEKEPKKEKNTEPIKKEVKKHHHKTFASAIAVSIIVSAFIGAIAGFGASEVSNKGIRSLVQRITGLEEEQGADGATGPGTATSRKGSFTVLEEESAVIDVVEQASPAVVSVIVTKDVPRLDSFFSDPFADDPFFNPFGFRRAPESEPETEKREIGGGTGFIVSEEGFIVTNRHVVDDEDAEYSVILNDGSRFDATVLARDSFIDIAIIKIETDQKLPVIDLGDSDSLKIGQTVVAIGNSLGEFRNTVSKGIISGLKRSVNAGDGRGRSELLDEVIQTDAAINPGNSGGPIVNLSGQVVGVNVAMAQGAENIGFAIPINEVDKIYRSVKDNGRIVRPYIGVRYALVNKQLQESNDLPFDHGALILRGQRESDLAVLPGSPADKAGLLENDIILEVDGMKISQDQDLARLINRKDVGDQVTLKIWSKGEEKVVTVVLEEASQ